MIGQTVAIVDRPKQEELLPVVTFVPGLQRHRAIDALLSFLSVCHHDCYNRIRLPDLLSAEHETRCLRLLDDVIGGYFHVDNLKLSVQADICDTAHSIVAGLSAEHAAFLKDRLLKICGDDGYRLYWKAFEDESCLEEISRYENSSVSVLQLKKSIDFAAVIIALAVLYGCGNDFYERIAALDDAMSAKFKTGVPGDALGLYLWPLDFSFAQSEDPEAFTEITDEHRALLKAVRSISPDVKVQVCAESLVWSRDIIAWVSDDYDLFVEPAGNVPPVKFGCGMLNEGGNIIAGTANDKFILLPQGTLPDVSSEVSFRYEMDKRNIQTYVLPEGFIWSRNPRTGKDYALDSIHIDAVINFIPSECTLDNRPKLIVDPYYFAMIQGAPDFTRLLSEQSIAEADIVIVDTRELYLNLPNFSVLPDRSGTKKFLFNKDQGYTLPRLALKPGLLVQPDIEIAAMASSLGSIRCATNMLPGSYVKSESSLTIAVSDTIPPETRRLLNGQIHVGAPLVTCLSRLFVSHIAIQPGPKGIPWEFDEFSRTAYFYYSPRQVSNPEVCVGGIADCMKACAETLSRRLGIDTDPDHA